MGQERIRKVKELTILAEQGKTRLPRSCIGKVYHVDLFSFIELQTTMSALALAWVAKNPNTSTVILGASRPEQILENLKALEVLPKLTPEIMEKIESILGSAPESLVRCFILACVREGLLIILPVKCAFSLRMGAQCWIGLVGFKESYEPRVVRDAGDLVSMIRT